MNQPATIAISDNGNIMAFDIEGHQIPELHFNVLIDVLEKMKKCGIDIFNEQLKISVLTSNGIFRLTPIRTKYGINIKFDEL